MLRVTAMGGGAERYYTTLHREDYYARLDAPLPGQWVGKGVPRLGLSGDVSPDAFRALFRGFDPQEPIRPLVQNAGRLAPYENSKGEMTSKGLRDPGWDVTMSAPKSFSVLYAMSSPEERTWLSGELLGASREAFSLLEQATTTRAGKGGSRREETELVGALFIHTTARAVGESMPDPQLHVHGIVFNVGVSPSERTEDGHPKTRTIGSRQFYELQQQADQVFLSALAARVSERYTLEHGPHSWEVRGVPRALCEELSKRSAEIEKVAGREAPAWEREKAALTTRARKKEIPRGEVEASWRDAGKRYGFGREEAERLRHGKSDTRNVGYTTTQEHDRRAREVRNLVAFSRHEMQEQRGPEGSLDELRERAFRRASVQGFRVEEVERALRERPAREAARKHEGAKEPKKTARPRPEKRSDPEVARRDMELLGRELGRIAERKKVIALTWSNAERETFNARAGLEAVTVSRLLREMERGFEKVPSRFELWRAEWDYATWQGSKKRRDFLRYQAEREERYCVDAGTLVVLHGPRSTSAKARALEHAVREAGGRLIYSEEAMLPRLQEAEHERETAQTTTQNRRRDHAPERELVRELKPSYR